MLYWITRTIILVIFNVFFGVKTKGKGAFPSKGPFILASNHLSNIDPPVLAVACPRRLNFLAKEELFKNKFFAFIIKTLGAVPLNRNKTDISAIRLVIKMLKQNKPILIFPQGTRGSANDEIFSGVGFLVKKTSVPVVIAKITNTDKVLPKGAKFFKRCPVKVVFKRMGRFEEGADYDAIARKVFDEIKSL